MSDRDQYVEKAKAKLDRWNAEIDKMQAKVDEANADAKIKYQKQFDEMRAQRDAAEARLNEIVEASDDAWDDVRAGFEKAWNNIADAFESAMTRFR